MALASRALCSFALPMAVVISLGSLPAEGAPRRKTRRDTTPPIVEHVPLVQHDGAGPLRVDARIVDAESAVFEPTLLVRSAGSESFTRVPMTASSDAPGVWTAEVPRELLAADVEYFVEAFDGNGNGPSRVGDEAAPLRVVRRSTSAPATGTLAQDQVVETTVPAVQPAQSEDEGEGMSPVVIGAGVLVGAVVLAGVAAGVGFALYASQPEAPSVVTLRVRGPGPIAGAAP